MFLRQILRVAKDDSTKVIVLHCRDKGDRRAAKDTLHLLKECGVVTHKIHRHCFTVNTEVLYSWLQEAPNALFAFAGAVFYNTNVCIQN